MSTPTMRAISQQTYGGPEVLELVQAERPAHAAAGGVGHLGVQMAKARGAHVIGTARQGKHEFLQGLGADELIDYSSSDFAAVVRDVDVVLDTIAGDYGPRSLDTLSAGGTLIDVRGTGPDRTAVRRLAQERGLRFVEFKFQPSAADLEELAASSKAVYCASSWTRSSHWSMRPRHTNSARPAA